MLPVHQKKKKEDEEDGEDEEDEEDEDKDEEKEKKKRKKERKEIVKHLHAQAGRKSGSPNACSAMAIPWLGV